MSSHQVSLAHRVRQTRRLLGAEGVQGITDRVRRRVAARIAPTRLERLPVSVEDMRRAADALATGRSLPRPLPWREGEPLKVAWVDVPPSQGSGGQTTIYRMIEALESHGHHCQMYLLDHHGWALEQHRDTIARCWPNVGAQIRDVAEGISDAHAVIATCWESVYPVIASPAAGARMYFVQDYEPMFYPAGSRYLLAEATYRFGLHGITAGRWLAEKLAADYQMSTDYFDFGVDTVTYGLDTSTGAASRRTGICYYCRPSTPRRAHELAMAALQLFAARHPDIDIHLYGERQRSVPFRVTQHGLLTPAGLNELYNRCVAGLTLSATNVSLVPHEMLAAGCIPVVNDADHNRVVLDNDYVHYARATPFDLAAALSEICDRPLGERSLLAAAASASVAASSWADAGDRVEAAVRRVVRGLQPALHV